MSQPLHPREAFSLNIPLSLNQFNKIVRENAVGDSIMKLSYNMATKLLEEFTKKNLGWHTRDFKVAKWSPTNFFVNKDQRKRDKGREENLAKMMT